MISEQRAPELDPVPPHEFVWPPLLDGRHRGRTCEECELDDRNEVHRVTPEGWCQPDEEEHHYDNGECRRCGAEEPWSDDDD